MRVSVSIMGDMGLLDAGIGLAASVVEQFGRADAKEPTDFLNLELSRFDELGLIGGGPEGMILEITREQRCFMRIAGAAILLLP